MLLLPKRSAVAYEESIIAVLKTFFTSLKITVT